jgi:putative ABC transport system ATP-binding protein
MTAALILDHVAHSVLEAGEAKPTLAALSRAFAPGRFCVIGGPSGAGKTTLLSVLSLTVRATRGMILWGDENLSALSPRAATEWRRQNLGMVFQTSRLVSVMTSAEHIKMAAAIRDRPEANDHGLSILAALGMGDKLTKRPDQLSGGEKQRVALAQALCSRPPVLLADEPTAALDHVNAELVAHTLRTYARERNAVVVCVSHDRAVIDAADDFLMLGKP